MILRPTRRIECADITILVPKYVRSRRYEIPPPSGLLFKVWFLTAPAAASGDPKVARARLTVAVGIQKGHHMREGETALRGVGASIFLWSATVALPAYSTNLPHKTPSHASQMPKFKLYVAETRLDSAEL